MALRKKNTPQLTPVQAAQQRVNDALLGFEMARQELAEATLVYRGKVEENNQYIEMLNADNEALNADADRVERVAAKLEELVA